MTWEAAAVAFLVLAVAVYLIVKRDPTHVETISEAVAKELKRRGGGD